MRNYCACLLVSILGLTQFITPAFAQPLRTGNQDNQEFAENFKTVLDFIFTLGHRQAIQENVDDLLPKIKENLLWSGEKGQLLQVVMARDTMGHQPSQLFEIQTLAMGDSPYQACVASRRISQLAGPPSGFAEIDRGATFYMWIVMDGNEAKKLYLAPELSAAMLEKAKTDALTYQVLAEMEPQREYKRLLTSAQEGARRLQDIEAKTALLDASTQLQTAKAQRDGIQSKLTAALEEQARIAGTLEWLNTLSSILTIAQLYAQADAMLNAPPKVSAVMKAATSADDLKNVIKIYDAEYGTTIPILRGDLQTYESIYIQKRTYIETKTDEIKMAPKQ